MEVSDRTKHGSGKYRAKKNAGQIIRAARLALDMSQAELGKRALGLENEASAKVAICNLEAGTGNPSPMRYLDAAGTLGLPWEDVIEFIPDGKR